jgi:predicted PurR-regulated permease PerM
MAYWEISLGILTALGIAALVWSAHQILLAFFAGFLFSVFLHHLARHLRRFVPVPQPAAVVLVVAFLLMCAVAAGFLLTVTVADQFTELSRRVPAAWQKTLDFVGQFEAYRNFVPDLNVAGQELVRRSGPLVFQVTTTVTNFTSLVLTLGVALIMGMYGALEPQLYRRGAIALVPAHRRDVVQYMITETEQALWKWSLGRLTTMIVIGTLTTAALQAFNIPLAAILGLLAGLLAIIPYLGAIVSAIPALLIGFSESPNTALTVLFIFIGVQIVEGNLITPLIERRIVRLPPVLTIGVQLVLGVIVGPFGVMLASPLTAAVAAAVKAKLAFRKES